MFTRRFVLPALALLCAWASAQEQPSTPPDTSSSPAASASQSPDQQTPTLSARPKAQPADQSIPEKPGPRSIELVLPRGTAIRVALTQRLRIAHEGEPVHAKVTEPVFAFDQEVIPAGTEVTGHVTRIAPISGFRRALDIADADFTPSHQYSVTFETLLMADGRQLALVTTASPGTEDVVHLVSNPESAARRKNAAERAIDSAKEDAKARLRQAANEIKTPGRLHRAKQYLLAQLPYHRQYLDPGTRFDADLEEPLAFGATTRQPEQLASVGAEPPPDSLLHARLAVEVSSATARHGTPIEAVVTEPLFDAGHHLVLPANSRILGEVVQAKPAGKLHHNGELRVVFQKVVTPEGLAQPALGSLEGVEVARAASLKLDREGGAEATDSKTRYLSTALAIGIAVVAAHPEHDNGDSDGLADPGTRASAGHSGFKLVGAIVSTAAQSKAFSSVLGIYGASMSVYSHFLAKGKNVVFPKDTPIEIALGQQRPAPDSEKPPAQR